MNHPNRLYDLRMIRQISQRELAQRTGQSQVAINKQENGHRRIPKHRLTQYAEVLACQPVDLFVDLGYPDNAN